jgi:hypothetical protein
MKLPISSSLRQELVRSAYDVCDSDVTAYEVELEDRMAQIERQIGDMQARLDVLERRQQR